MKPELKAMCELLYGMTTNGNVQCAIKNYFLWWSQFDDCVGAVAAAGDYLDTPAEVDEFAFLLNELVTN